MKTVNSILIIVVIIGVGFTMGFPKALFDGPTYELILIEDVDVPMMTTKSEEAPIRHRRVTCDLLSASTPWVTVNHSACAMKCLSQRRRGGSCQDGVCVCR